MNSTGSYSANLRAGSDTWLLIWLRQGEVSTTMGSLPPSLATIRARSRSEPIVEAAPVNPRLSNKGDGGEWVMMCGPPGEV